MTQTRTILVTVPLDEELEDRIRRAAPEFRVEAVAPDAPDRRLAEAAAEAEIWFGMRLTPEAFAGARRLRWIQTISAGVDRYLFPELQAADVILTNVRGMHADTIADHVFMCMLALARNLPRMVHQQAARRWQRVPVQELAGDVLGVIGLGGIGREIARRGRAFKLRVIGTRRSGDPVPEADAVYGPEGLDDVLAAARWIVLACPLTEETRGLIGPRQLDRIGPDGFLINIGRGGLVDEEALVAALRDGRIAGAALDVFASEPLPEESPLWTLPNVLITPHLAGSQRQYVARAAEVFLENLARYRSGAPLVNVVDKRLGY